MSLVSFTSNKQGVQDLLAALPAPASPPTDRTRGNDQGQDAKPGFNDLLRDSSEAQQAPQRSDAPEPADAQPRSESQQEEQAAADKPEQAEQDTQSNDASDGSSQGSSEDDTSGQENAEASAENSENQAKDTSEEAQVQAAANAVSAQLNVIEATETNQPKAQVQASVNQQIDSAQLKEVDSGDKPAGQGQANVSNLSLNAALPNQAQSPTGPTVQADAAASVQPVLQQGDNTQSNSGDTRGDSNSTTSANNVNTTASSSSNAAAATAFTAPDQASGEARLPISTTPTAQSVDAARQAQAQAAVNTGDNDSLNTARLTRGLANAVQQRGGAVTLRLTPPEMGTVRIQMQITGTNVSASFHAESASAQTLLTNQLAHLRSALESKGMSVEKLTVQPLAATASSQNANQNQNQSDTQQQGQGQQQGAGDGRSRGQYSGDGSRQQSSDPQQDSGTNQSPGVFFDSLSDASEVQAA
ncbi:MAG: flagellar hook-length control protein FliK [Phycisphaeraceae bacterium]|nr:flagellar hook-length control protein FliK [Phycisphaeraceae bacterium]